MSAPPPYRPASESGTPPHALAFLAYLPVPILNFLVAGLVMWLSYLAVRRRGPRAEAIARTAGNWGITLLILTPVIIAAGILGIVVSSDEARPVVGGLFGLVYLALGVAQLVIAIVGTVKASRGVVWRNPIAIPFFRGPREHGAAVTGPGAASGEPRGPLP